MTVLALWTVVVVLVVREPPTNVLSWDTFGYYLYLPATFLHGDPGLLDHAWVQKVMDTYHNSATFYQAQELPDGRWVLKYPMGLAILWAPFFAVAHSIAALTGHARDGFSAPYQWAIICASLFYTLVGLVVLRKVLLHFFPDRITAIVLALLVLGTNYLHQSLYASGMPHVFLFTLYAGILWLSIRWHAQHRLRDAIMLAMVMGLTILSRPSEAVCLAIPVLVGLTEPQLWKEQLAVLFRHRAQLLVAMGVLLLIGAPQFIYWKWLTGRFLYMSYNNPGEGFEFLHPYLWEVLFSSRKGWYIYTPIMLVATAGLFLLRERMPGWKWALVTFFVMNVFLVGSWSCWWYADSFGQRAFVQSYAVMALPLGAVVGWLGSGRLRAFLGGSILVALTAFNLFQTYQSANGLIHTSRMTWPAYKAVFGRTTPPPDLAGLLMIDRPPTGEYGEPDLRIYRKVPFRTMGFDAPFSGNGSDQRRDSLAFRGSASFLLTADHASSPSIHAQWAALTAKDHLWVHVACAVHRTEGIGASKQVCLVSSFQHGGFDYGVRTLCLDPSVTSAEEWSRISYWYLTPEVRRPTDELVVRAELQEGSPTLVDEIEVTLYEPIEQQ